MRCFAGVDVGGTKRAAVLIDASGVTLATDWAEHQGAWHGRVADGVVASIEAVLGRAGLGIDGVDAIGVAVAGLVGRDRATLVHSPIIRETHVDLGPQLVVRTGRPVSVHNDANATLYAIARHERSLDGDSRPGGAVHVLLTLGTGLGGAILVGDQILVGEQGFAGELGHLIVETADQGRCVCGSRGCVEQYASGRGLEKMAREMPIPATSAASLAALGVTGDVSARDVVALAELGDAWAAGLLARAGQMLGRAITNLCVTLDPTTVTIGGTLGHVASPWLLRAAEAEMRDRWTYADNRPMPRLAVDAIGPHAAATGAALLAAASFDEEQALE